MNRDLTRPLNISFYCGLSVLFIGTLFKVQHWPGGQMLFMSGLVLELFYGILAMLEMATSTIASMSSKVLWMSLFVAGAAAVLFFMPLIAFAGFIFLMGNAYNKRGRYYFVRKKGKYDGIEFDSIDVHAGE